MFGQSIAAVFSDAAPSAAMPISSAESHRSAAHMLANGSESISFAIVCAPVAPSASVVSLACARLSSRRTPNAPNTAESARYAPSPAA